MKKNRYDVEVLTDALNFLHAYEQKKGDQTCTGIIMSDIAFLIMSDIASLMKSIAFYVDGMSPSGKQNKLDVFQVITEISFDKLEKDVMGVN